MSTLELMNDHPKTTTIIKQWYLDRLLETMNDDNLPEDFKENVKEKGIDNQVIANMIDVAPRGVFDIFDNHKIFISIIWKTLGFVYEINGICCPDMYKTRIECEKAAMEEAYKLLNDKI